MLDWVEIRRVGRPIKSPDVELSDKFLNNASTVGRALSSRRTAPWFILPRNGTMTGWRMSSRDRWALRFPSTIQSRVLWFIVTPAKTTTKPPPNQSYSLTVASENLSPWRLYALVVPSLKCRLNRLSLEKSTLDHCCLVHWMCWWHQSRRARLWRCVNVVRKAGRLDRRFPGLYRFQTVSSEMFTPVEVLSWCYKAIPVIRRFLRVMLQM